MQSVAWDMMYKSSTQPSSKRLRGDRRVTLRRIGGFARPHRRRIGWFLLLSVFTAVLTVVTPLLAGRVVNVITESGSEMMIVGLAVAIALIAVAEAAAQLHDGSVVIAAITSCTNTSNPYVMVAAGLVAKKAAEKAPEKAKEKTEEKKTDAKTK